MPSPKSARVSVRRHAKNAPLRTRARTFIAKARRLLSGDDIEAAELAVKEAVIALDKAAQKGALHQNNADRRKSRIMKQLHQVKEA